MRQPGSILRVFAVLAALLQMSCIDGHEEIWLNADGSGRAAATYSLPAAAARFHGGETGVRQMIEGFLKKSSAIIDPTCEVATAGDRLTVHVSGAFRSALDLKSLGSGESLENLPSSARELAGEIRFERHGRTFEFARTVWAGKALAGSMFLPASRFKGRKLTYIAHLPVAARTSNATAVTDQGKTLTWEFPLQQAIRQPVVVRFTAVAPIPTWMYALAVVLVVASGAAVTAFLRLRRRADPAPPDTGQPRGSSL